MPPRFPRPVTERFWKAVRKAQKLPEAEWPEIPKRERRRKDPRADARFNRLKSHRDRVAEQLELDQTLIASKATMEQLAADPTEETAGGLLMDWQRALMRKAVDSLIEEAR